MKPQHARALDFIRDSIVRKGFSPSVQDLADMMGFKSKHSAALIIDKLIEDGFLQRREGGSRQLQLSPQRNAQNQVNTATIPLVGVVSCGLPLFAEENIEAQIPVSLKLATPPHRYFFLRAKGDSMNKAGIEDGELVLVRQQQTATPGEHIVALIDDEATIKEYRPAKGLVMLVPHSWNPEHKPIIVESDFQIQGVVVAAIPDVSSPVTYVEGDESP